MLLSFDCGPSPPPGYFGLKVFEANELGLDFLFEDLKDEAPVLAGRFLSLFLLYRVDGN